jgi:hypothetical protein
MGCNGSKPERNGEQRHPAPVIGAPQSVQIHIPRNRADQHGVPVQQVTREVDRDTLFRALSHASAYLGQRRHHISVIAVGGAVNNLYLRSRATTHDVDIFGSDFSNQARMLLDEAVHDTRLRYPQLGTDWLNTETQMWMTPTMQQELTQLARRQNVKVFGKDGDPLIIYAAPWSYAFSAKISRILTGDPRAYDLQDAITYLHQYILSHGNRPVNLATAFEWARHYHHESNKDILRRVNRAYQERYHAYGIVA